MACGQTLLPVSCAGPFRPEQQQCRHPGWLGGPPHLLRLNERMTSSTVAVLPVPGMPLTYRHLPASAGSADTKQGRPGGRQVGRWPDREQQQQQPQPASPGASAGCQSGSLCRRWQQQFTRLPTPTGRQSREQAGEQADREAGGHAGRRHSPSDSTSSTKSATWRRSISRQGSVRGTAASVSTLRACRQKSAEKFDRRGTAQSADCWWHRCAHQAETWHGMAKDRQKAMAV